MEDRVASELPQLFGLLSDMKKQIEPVHKLVTSLQKRVSEPDFDTSKGITLLELKHSLLLSYLINLVQLVLLKVEGQPIDGCATVSRLVELRVVLEKLRPLDKALRYQVDKLIKTASTGVVGAAGDPLRFRPNPANMMSQGSSGSEDEDGGGDLPDKAYVPPKMAAVPYTLGEEGGGKSSRENKLLKQRFLQSSIIQDLKNEYLDTPEELRELGLETISKRKLQEEKELQRLEEEHLVRVPRKRKQRDGGWSVAALGDELVDFAAGGGGGTAASNSTGGVSLMGPGLQHHGNKSRKLIKKGRQRKKIRKRKSRH